MKITRNQLRQLIQEELSRAIREKESTLNESAWRKEEFADKEDAQRYKDYLENKTNQGEPDRDTAEVLLCVNKKINANEFPAHCMVPGSWS